MFLEALSIGTDSVIRSVVSREFRRFPCSLRPQVGQGFEFHKAAIIGHPVPMEACDTLASRISGGTTPKFCMFHKRVLLPFDPVEHAKLRGCTSVSLGSPNHRTRSTRVQYCTRTTRNVLTFANTTAIVHRQNLEALADFLPVRNSNRFTNVRTLRGRTRALASVLIYLPAETMRPS